MKKLTNAEAGLKKSNAYKKTVYFNETLWNDKKCFLFHLNPFMTEADII